MTDLQSFFLACSIVKENFSFTVRSKTEDSTVCKWIVKFK